jgi:hypothetical protein
MPRASSATKPKIKVPRDTSVVTKTPEERHKIVADALMEGYSESDALRAGGYHPSNGKNVIRQEDVQGHLTAARQELEEITTIKRLDVLNIFLEAINMARIQADPANMIGGAREIAKMMGYNEPEKKVVEFTGDDNVLKSKIRQMSDEDLYELAYGKAKVIQGEVLN